jgi:hypothetical protein
MSELLSGLGAFNILGKEGPRFMAGCLVDFSLLGTPSP